MVIITEFQVPESPIIYEQRNTTAVLDKRDLGPGTLYVSERTLCWKGQDNLGFCIEYPHVSMHAVSTDQTIHASECIFMIIDSHISLPGNNEEIPRVNEQQEEDEDDPESEPNFSELLLVPSESTAVPPIYAALSRCQTLNPDPEDMVDEEDNVYEDAEDHQEEYMSNGRINDLAAGGDTEVNYLSARMYSHSLQPNHSHGNGDQNFDDDQFEDAD